MRDFVSSAAGSKSSYGLGGGAKEDDKSEDAGGSLDPVEYKEIQREALVSLQPEPSGAVHLDVSKPIGKDSGNGGIPTEGSTVNIELSSLEELASLDEVDSNGLQDGNADSEGRSDQISSLEVGSRTRLEDFEEASSYGIQVGLDISVVTLDEVDGDESGDGIGEADSIEDDGEDDEVWGGRGLKGYLGTVEEPWKLTRQYFPSKAGGCPAWLDPVNLPRGKQILCGICDKPLQFVLQVYAPGDDNPVAFHRSLFVFICTSLACLEQDQRQQQRKDKSQRSVKVFRCQLPRDNAFYSSTAPSADGNEASLCTGAALCKWCGTWKGDKVCGGCKQTRYCSQTHQMDHWRAGHAPHCRKVQSEIESASPNSSVESVSSSGTDPGTGQSIDPDTTQAASTSLWPEFELIVEDFLEEDEEDEDHGTESNSEARRLLADYERRRQQEREMTAKDLQDVEESTLEEQHWAAFQARITKTPEQVLWYLRSTDAKPLWPRIDGHPQQGDITTCPLCGGERSFEFQILPQLLYFFKVKDDIDSLDWGTIAVYSCVASCATKGYCEEVPWVQLSMPC